MYLSVLVHTATSVSLWRNVGLFCVVEIQLSAPPRIMPCVVLISEILASVPLPSVVNLDTNGS